ncbi:MAG: molybdopterin-dependent oxidoreductase [Deltaproteobacteria bacterium]
MGGGFGGKTRNRQVVEAARLAVLTEKPVQVAWTRAEEFFYDTFRPAAVIRIASGLSSSNRMVFWDYHVHYAGDRGAISCYDAPHQRGAPSGKGRGMACGIYKGTYVAALGEAEVDKSSGRCRLKRVVFAQDMGEVINPEGARMQIEGYVMMGLGYAFSETIRFRNGEIIDLKFDTYQIPTFSWMPKITVLLIDNPDIGPQEGGEPAITCMGALAANVVFDATGIRFNELPLTPERVREGLKSVKKAT